MNRLIVRRTITPSPLQIIVCIFLASLVFIINLREWIIGRVSESASIDPTVFNSSIDNYTRGVTDFAQSTPGKAIFLLLFSVGLTILGYGILLHSRRKNKEAARGSTIKGQVSGMSSVQQAQTWLYRIVILGILTALIFVTISYTQPLWLSIVNQAVLHPLSPLSMVAVGVAFIGSTINYYALWEFVKLAFIK